VIVRNVLMAEREGFESAVKRKLNNMQVHGWHLSTRKAATDRQTDCRTDRSILLFQESRFPG
jgi:hypothetical protein